MPSRTRPEGTCALSAKIAWASAYARHVSSQRSVRSNIVGIVLCGIVGVAAVFEAVANGATSSWISVAVSLMIIVFCVQDLRKGSRRP